MSVFIDYYERYIHINSWKGSKNVKSNVTKKLLRILKRDIGNMPWTLEAKSTYAGRVWGYVPEKITEKVMTERAMLE